MDDLLFLAHRLPFPPDKGEKIRSWHLLRHLGQRYHLHVGCLVDDPADEIHVPALAAHCAELMWRPIDRRRQRLAALLRVRPGKSLSEGYFADAELARWVTAKLARIRHVFVYCSAMAPYVMAAPAGTRRVLDMVDVDSEKFRAYAGRSGLATRLIWAREARTLLALERRAAASFDRTLLVSGPERDLFATLAPDCAARLAVIHNGVDLDRFAPGHDFANPFEPGEVGIVFTGTMDYWPNVDAVTWFAREVLPAVRQAVPAARFSIVGANPASAVTALEGAAVRVTGRVADTRPWISHAAAVVAPLRLARGIQNKVLEAMACGRPVIASPQAYEGVRARPGQDLLVADGAAAFAQAVITVLQGGHPELGAAARQAMASYGWGATLAPLDAIMTPAPIDQANPRRQPNGAVSPVL